FLFPTFCLRSFYLSILLTFLPSCLPAFLPSRLPAFPSSALQGSFLRPIPHVRRARARGSEFHQAEHAQREPETAKRHRRPAPDRTARLIPVHDARNDRPHAQQYSQDRCRSRPPRIHEARGRQQQRPYDCCRHESPVTELSYSRIVGRVPCP